MNNHMVVSAQIFNILLEHGNLNSADNLRHNEHSLLSMMLVTKVGDTDTGETLQVYTSQHRRKHSKQKWKKQGN